MVRNLTVGDVLVANQWPVYGMPARAAKTAVSAATYIPRKIDSRVPVRRKIDEALKVVSHYGRQERAKSLGKVAVVGIFSTNESTRDRRVRNKYIVDILRYNQFLEKGHIVGVQPIIHESSTPDSRRRLISASRILSRLIDEGRAAREVHFNADPIVFSGSSKAAPINAHEGINESQSELMDLDGDPELIVVGNGGQMQRTFSGIVSDSFARAPVAVLNPDGEPNRWEVAQIPLPKRTREPATDIEYQPEAVEAYTEVALS